MPNWIFVLLTFVWLTAKASPVEFSNAVSIQDSLPPVEAHTPTISGWGTAFLVAPSFLVTNAHLITKPIRLRDPSTQKTYIPTVVAVDAKNDLALLHVHVPGTPLPLAPDIKVATPIRVLIVGFPEPAKYGISPKLSIGMLPPSTSSSNGPGILLRAAVFPGNSGSPICNESGQLVGVVKGGITTPLLIDGVASRSEPIPVAVSLAELRDLLTLNQVPWLTGGTPQSLSDVATQMAKATYLVEQP